MSGPEETEALSLEELEPVPAIRQLSRREVYRNHWMRVYEDEIERSNGERGIYGVVEKDPAALIIPIDKEKVWLVEQFRYTTGHREMEFPQGGWERADVDPEELARGELQEETGLTAQEMIKLGEVWISYGFTRQKQHVYLARGLSKGPAKPDAEEHDIQVMCIPVEDLEQKIAYGAIGDSCTLSAWALYKIWLERDGGLLNLERFSPKKRGKRRAR